VENADNVSVVFARPIDEADIEQQWRREAARLYRDRRHVSNDDTVSNFEDLSVFGGSLETIEQVSRSTLLTIVQASVHQLVTQVVPEKRLLNRCRSCGSSLLSLLNINQVIQFYGTVTVYSIASSVFILFHSSCTVFSKCNIIDSFFVCDV